MELPPPHAQKIFYFFFQNSVELKDFFRLFLKSFDSCFWPTKHFKLLKSYSNCVNWHLLRQTKIESKPCKWKQTNEHWLSSFELTRKFYLIWNVNISWTAVLWSYEVKPCFARQIGVCRAERLTSGSPFERSEINTLPSNPPFSGGEGILSASELIGNSRWERAQF